MTVPTPRDDPEAVVHRSRVEALLYRWLLDILHKDQGGWDYIIDVAFDLLDLTQEQLAEIRIRAYADREGREAAEYARWEEEDAARERAGDPSDGR